MNNQTNYIHFIEDKIIIRITTFCICLVCCLLNEVKEIKRYNIQNIVRNQYVFLGLRVRVNTF